MCGPIERSQQSRMQCVASSDTHPRSFLKVSSGRLNPLGHRHMKHLAACNGIYLERDILAHGHVLVGFSIVRDQGKTEHFAAVAVCTNGPNEHDNSCFYESLITGFRLTSCVANWPAEELSDGVSISPYAGIATVHNKPSTPRCRAFVAWRFVK